MSLKKHLEKSKREKSAVGQFNFSTPQQLKGIVAAAKKAEVPVILGTSRGESEFIGVSETVALRNVLRETYSEIYLNLDHGRDLDWVRKAIEAGYDMIHFDGSDLPLEENIEKTKRVVDMAEGLVVEGEVGKVGGSSKMHEGSPESTQDLTSTENLVKFIKQTEVDLCAFSIGNIHGVYGEMPELDFDRLEEIRKRVDSGLVLHGGSGIDEEDVKKTIRKGVVKVNVNTELRQAWRQELETSLKEKSDEVTPYKILSGIADRTQKKVEEKINIFQNP